MSAKPKSKPTKKTTQYVDLNEILEQVADSLDSLADSRNLLSESVATIVRRMEEAEENTTNWKLATTVAITIGLINTIWLFLK